jgi:hypothetical protein
MSSSVQIACGRAARSIFPAVGVKIVIVVESNHPEIPWLMKVHMIGYELIKTGLLVSFRIVEEEVLAAPDEAEFGMRLLLKFVAEEGEDDQDEDDGAEETAEWRAFGFMFVLGVLSFDEAKPRNASSVLALTEKSATAMGADADAGAAPGADAGDTVEA